MPYYRVDSTVPAYANRFGLKDKYVYANSPSEARRTALALIGPNLPAAALALSPVSGIEVMEGLVQPLTRQSTGQQVTAVDPTGYIPSEFEEGLGASGFTGVTDPLNIEGFYRSGAVTGNVPGAQNLPGLTGSDVPGFNLPYRGTGQNLGSLLADVDPQSTFTDFINELEGGPQNLLYPADAAPPRRVTLPYDATSGPPTKELLPYYYGDAYTSPPPVREPLIGQAEALVAREEIPEDFTAASLESMEGYDEAAAAAELKAIQTNKLLTGPIRSWDDRVKDIKFVGPKGARTPVLPPDMFRWNNKNPIGDKELERVFKHIADSEGSDNYNELVGSFMVRARRHYADAPIEERLDIYGHNKLTDSKYAYSDAYKNLRSDTYDTAFGERKDVVTGEIEGAETGRAIFDAEADAAERAAIAEEVAAREAREAAADATTAAAKAMEYDPLGGGETGMAGFGGPPVPPGVAAPAVPAVPGADDDYYYGDTFAGDPNQFDFAQGAMEGFPPPSAAPPAPTAGTVGVPAFSSQDLINDPQGFLTAAGQRLALRNVFGEPATGVGPLASYLQRQTYPLTDAYRAGGFANIAREQAGEIAPQTTFEDFLTSVRDQPTGLGGAYGQALQNVDYLRGLGGSQVPTALAGVFNPEQAANTRDARSLLEAAQRGKYSRLVSSAFRRPTEGDLFADYVLAKQDATAGGLAPQNFLNFAASRYGL